LAGAELGWAVDQRRLYIGNGTLAEGAPVVGNTEILTEFSDLLAFTTAYTYRGDAAGYTAQTGPTPGTPISQSLQSRLDSYAIVTDFGARGDGATDDTAAINRALFQLYCVQSNTQIRRSLFFPAGTYKISNTLLIPPYAKLYGEGASSSIISFEVVLWAANTAYAGGVLVADELDNYYRSTSPVPATGILLNDTEYWSPVSLPEYVVRTTDSKQQTGVNIGLAGATYPTNVEISSMALRTATSGNDSSVSHNICLLEQIDQIYLDSVDFQGPLDQSSLGTATEDLAAVRFSSTSARTCRQVILDKCRFVGVTYAINTDQATHGVTVSNGQFDTLYQGIVLGDAAPVNGGPTGFRIVQNIFDNIYEEGVIIENCSFNATAYNTFYDVGNHFFGNANPATPIISINANDNISLGDTFQRTVAQTQISPGYPRIYLFDVTIPTSIVTSGGQYIQMGSYVRESGQQATITDGATDQTLFAVSLDRSVANGGFLAFRMDYTITRTIGELGCVRTGTLTSVGGSADDSSLAVATYSDDYVENLDPQVQLSVSESYDPIAGNVTTVFYSASSTGTSGIIYYSLNHLA
jgi:hypothetical protein